MVNDVNPALFLNQYRRILEPYELAPKYYVGKMKATKSKEWFKRKINFLKKLVAKAIILPVENLADTIKNELIQPRTAFLSPGKHFELDWEIFERAMKSQSLNGIKFVPGLNE